MWWNKFKDFVSNLFKKSRRGAIIVEKRPFYIYKKKTPLEYVSLILGILISVLIIYNLMKMNGSLDKFVKNEKHIGVVKIQGIISADSDANVYSLTRSLNEAFKNPNSKAIVLQINSGGGAPYDAEMVWKEIQYLKTKYPKKKVYAVIESVGASAAYYIATGADEIIVGNSTIIGSIGVRMDNYDIRELMNKIGVKDRSFHSGEDKLSYSMTKEITPDQESHLNEMLSIVHQDFIDAVKAGRGNRISDNPNLYGGKFWAGKQSISLGLADKIGDMNSLKRDLKISQTEDYTIRKDSLSEIFKMSAESIGKGIGLSVKNEIMSNDEAKLR